MKVGISFRIDLTKVDKSRIYVGEKGKYLTVTSFVDLDNKDQYDNNGFITHEKQQGEDRPPIIGNSRVFWKGDSQPQGHQPAPTGGGGDFDDDIPFAQVDWRL